MMCFGPMHGPRSPVYALRWEVGVPGQNHSLSGRNRAGHISHASPVSAASNRASLLLSHPFASHQPAGPQNPTRGFLSRLGCVIAHSLLLQPSHNRQKRLAVPWLALRSRRASLPQRPPSRRLHRSRVRRTALIRLVPASLYAHCLKDRTLTLRQTMITEAILAASFFTSLC